MPQPFSRLVPRRPAIGLVGAAFLLGGAAAPAGSQQPGPAPHRVLTGAAAYGDWRSDRPGLIRRITPRDLPAPSRSAAPGASIVPRPETVLPRVPPGFKAELYATLPQPRLLRTAPNGDVFVAQSGEGTISLLRPGAPGGAARVTRFMSGLDEPFGLAFYPPGPDPHYLYIGTVNAVLRIPYRNGDSAPRGKPETIASLPEGGHSTRDVLFTPDGRTLYVSVGSDSNDAEGGMEDETNRADILVFNPDGSGIRRYATGIRNPVGLALHPVTGDLWTAVNERDGLGDNLPPDYVTRVAPGAFYGWPWFYIGDHPDPRHAGEQEPLRRGIAIPDVLIQPHSAPLQLAVYTGTQFPAAYRNDLFVALHGSWNRTQLTGYKVVRVMLRGGKPTGEYQDFMTGFVLPDGKVWGRPVGVAVAADGALLVSDDHGGTIWRVSYAGGR